MTTTADIEALKRNWQADPCWDIEKTDGFNEYHDELLAFRIKYEQDQEKEYQEKIKKDCEKFNISAELLQLLRQYENRISDLEAKIECLCDKNGLTLSKWNDYKWLV